MPGLETYARSKTSREKDLEGILWARSLGGEAMAQIAARSAAAGAASGMIGRLETGESDMTKILAASTSEEKAAATSVTAWSKRTKSREPRGASCCMKGDGSKQVDKTLSENTADQWQCRLARCPMEVLFEIGEQGSQQRRFARCPLNVPFEDGRAVHRQGRGGWLVGLPDQLTFRLFKFVKLVVETNQFCALQRALVGRQD